MWCISRGNFLEKDTVNNMGLKLLLIHLIRNDIQRGCLLEYRISNRECRMTNWYPFKIRHSLFDIRYSLGLSACSAVPHLDLLAGILFFKFKHLFGFGLFGLGGCFSLGGIGGCGGSYTGKDFRNIFGARFL
jgi:hypothetical protein